MAPAPEHKLKISH